MKNLKSLLLSTTRKRIRKITNQDHLSVHRVCCLWVVTLGNANWVKRLVSGTYSLENWDLSCTAFWHTLVFFFGVVSKHKRLKEHANEVTFNQWNECELVTRKVFYELHLTRQLLANLGNCQLFYNCFMSEFKFPRVIFFFFFKIKIFFFHSLFLFF